MRNELQALALDVTLLDDEGNEVDLSKIDGEDTPSVIPTVKPVVEETETEELEEEIDDMEDVEEPVYTDGDEE